MSVKPTIITNLDGEYTEKQSGGGLPSFQTHVSVRGLAESSQTFSGSDSPKPWAKFRTPRPYTADIIVRNGFKSHLTITRQFDKRRYEYSGHITRPLFSYDTIPSSVMLLDERLEQATRVKAYLKVKNQKVNLAVAFAEARKTADHLNNTIMSVVRSVRDFRTQVVKGKFLKGAIRRYELERARKLKYSDPLGKLVASSREAGSRWLEIQYAWTPLLLDVEGSCKALSVDPMDYRAYVTASESRRFQHVVNSGFTGAYGMKISIPYEVMTRCKTRFDFVPDFPAWRAFTQLGITNPLEVAWEVVPYSFVVDWFYPIGDWLSTFDAVGGIRFLAGSSSLSGKAYGGKPWLSKPVPGYTLGSYGLNVRLERHCMNRQVFHAWPASAPPIPSLDGFVGKKWITSLALLQNLLR